MPIARTMLVVCTLLGLLTNWCPAQITASTQPTTTEEPGLPTTEEIASRRTAIENATDLPEAARVECLELYQRAGDFLNQVQTWRERSSEFAAGQVGVPELVRQVRERLQTAPAPVVPSADSSTLESLRQQLLEAEAQARSAVDQVQRLDLESQHRAERRTAIPDLVAKASGRDEKQRAASVDPGDTQLSPVLEARRYLAACRRMAIAAELKLYREELQFYDARAELLTLRREEARVLASAAETRATLLREALTSRRELEAAAQRSEAEQQIRNMPPGVRELAEQNRNLVNEWDTLAGEIRETEREVARTSDLTKSLTTQLSTMKSRNELEEVGDLLGPMMRKQRSELLRLRQVQRQLQQTRAAFARTQVRMEALDVALYKLTPLQTAVALQLEQLLLAGEGDEDLLRTQLEALLKAQIETTRKLKRDYETYSNDLVELASVQSRLLSKTQQVAQFIDEHVLWIRSGLPLHQISWVADPKDLSESAAAVRRAWKEDVATHWWMYAVASLAWLGLLIRQRSIADALRIGSETVSRPLSDRFGLTWLALLQTTLLALPLPLALWWTGWRLQRLDVTGHPGGFELAVALSHGLHTAAAVFFLLWLIRHASRRYGLAPAHFGWPPAALALIRRCLLWYAPALALLTFLVATADTLDANWSVLFGRLAFLVAIGVSLLVVRQLLHPRHGMLVQPELAQTMLARCRWPLLIGLQLLLLGLAVASWTGFHYTAITIAALALRTAGLGMLVLLTHAMGLRWLSSTQRRMAIEEARQRRAAHREHPTRTDEPTDVTHAEAEEVQLGVVSSQSRSLLDTLGWVALASVLWITSSDLLPALSFLHDVTLWTYTDEVTTRAADGTVSIGPILQAITLANLLQAVLILVVTFLLTRNLPGLLEMALLRRLPIDAGMRFATNAILRYLIVVIGLVLAFSSLGIGWSSVQWLVAAITVGLGFGLQEIFANFVSGLILLFERPIRIGDTVTVAGVTGTVTRIRIRATTVMDWDRKELVIPNREFVTGEVINWTLTDQMLRLVLKVGIAYGSDTRRAKQILLDVCRAHPRVLENPKPRVWFWAFGSSSLDFEIRVFVRDMDDWILARDGLHFQIDDAFREAGIDIAFPQQDIHVRSIEAVLPVARSAGVAG